MLDEVQSGLGRTGRLFAHEHLRHQPDVMTLAKALAGGLPMGALLATEEVAAAFVPGTHASTFGAGPVIAAAAKTAVRLLSDAKLLAEVRAKGDYLAKGFDAVAGQVSGNQRGAGPGPDVGPGAGPGGRGRW